MVLRHSLSVRRARLRSILPNALITVMFAMLMAVPSRADEVTFVDLTDTLSDSTSSTRISGGCVTTGGTEICTVTIVAPPNAASAETTPSPPIFIGEGDGTVSDIITTTTNGPSVQVNFNSDWGENGLGFFCVDISAGCAITEDGTVQLGETIVWKDSAGTVLATDTVKFQSNPEAPPVPEPVSVVLLGSGLVALIGRIRKRPA